MIFYFYSVFFIERYLEKKGIEPNDEIIRGNPNCSSAYSLIINQIKNEPEIKDYLILQKINLDSLENTKSLFGKNKFIGPFACIPNNFLLFKHFWSSVERATT